MRWSEHQSAIVFCNLGEKSMGYQCCCKCKFHAPIHHHCSTDIWLRKKLGDCVCKYIKGWACTVVYETTEPKEHGYNRIHDRWPEHACGCEMFTEEGGK